MAKAKFYVVWVGMTPGIYDSWDRVKGHVQGFPDAKYMSFKSREMAEAAYKLPWEEFYAFKSKSERESEKGAQAGKRKSGKPKSFHAHINEIEGNSISVDAACSGNPGVMEYRGVETVTGKQIFRPPAFRVGTNNIGEFLAIVHALALFHEKAPDLTIYTDSRTAMGWVKKKKANTKLKRTAATEKLWQMVERGEKWLKTHSYKNPIVKWETERWGEIPADFGRK